MTKRDSSTDLACITRRIVNQTRLQTTCREGVARRLNSLHRVQTH